MTRIVAGLVLVGFAIIIGLIASTGVLFRFDAAVLRAVSLGQGGMSAETVEVGQLVSTFGDLGVRGLVVLGVLAALLTRHRWRSGVIYLAVVATSIGGHTVAKLAFDRARPRLTPWLDDPHDLSFPSGHAAGTMVVLLLAALLFDRRPLVVPAVALSIVIGATRPMLGVHWPSDVVGGWLWGAGFALIGAGVARSLGLLDARFRPSSAAPS